MVRRTGLAALMSPVVVHWVGVFPYLARSLANASRWLSKEPPQLVAYEHQHFAARPVALRVPGWKTPLWRLQLL
jgi:hypothetical protein